jgi:hypothetical protein
MRVIFDAPTVAALAAHVHTIRWANASAGEPAQESEEVREEIEL